MYENPEFSVVNMIVHIGDNPHRDGLKETPDRVVRSWRELFSGYRQNPQDYLKVQFPVDASQMVHINAIPFYSTCEHHMLPFFGAIDIAYIPTNRVVGLSKFARVVEVFSRRLQVQERIVNQIADAMEEGIPTALGVAVRARGQHFCMMARGVECPAQTVTTALRGKFLTDPEVKREWLSGLPP
jgi:GTP cyclohydrolase IA